jgi:hypothetical protein
MLSSHWLLAPFVLQGIVIGVDEFYFHWRRGLPRWERLGHPLDTLTVAICLMWLCFQTPTALTVAVYILLSLISCLCVTKDEFVHAYVCTPSEHWLHAVLFLLHPLVLLGAGLMWGVSHNNLPYVRANGWEATALRGNVVMTILFGLYQFLFWNWLWQRIPRFSQKVPSTTKSITS